MENNWEPRVGQKVVALNDNNSDYGILKDSVQIVDAVEFCCPAAGFRMALKGIVDPHQARRGCASCHKHLANSLFLQAINFAPISEQYEDMTSEIAQQFKEHPDTVDQPVKILETVN